jgi:hypothetical protein
MRLILLAAAFAALAAPAFAEVKCQLRHAVYADPDNGFELRFRPGETWEYPGMTDAVIDMVTPGGEILWGSITSNMGTSRNVGHLFYGCPAPSADGDDLTEEQYDQCRQWEGVVYALDKGEPGLLPSEEEPAPERLLLTDLGRKIRYSDVVSSPGEEPWDVLDFKRCTGP